MAREREREIYIYIHACIQFRITTFIGSIEIVKICTDPSLPWGHHGRVTIHARTQRPVWLLVIQPAEVQILPLFTLGWPKDKDNNLDKDLVFDMVCGWTVPKTRIFYEFCGSPLCCFHGSLVGKLLTWDGQSMRWRVHIEGVGIKQLGGVEVFHGEQYGMIMNDFMKQRLEHRCTYGVAKNSEECLCQLTHWEVALGVVIWC